MITKYAKDLAKGDKIARSDGSYVGTVLHKEIRIFEFGPHDQVQEEERVILTVDKGGGPEIFPNMDEYYSLNILEEEDEMGYHKEKIAKGELGKPSKIREELDELEDALKQNNRIMALVELSDIYGALKAVAENLGTNMEEVVTMSNATEAAFKDGSRK